MYGESKHNSSLHWVQRTRAFATTILPLFFDNSLTYLEMLGRFSHKLNECIEAINAQNLNLIEFCHMVELEVTKFEEYINNRIDEFENEIKKQWEEYKNEMNAAWAAFKKQMLDEWEQEKQINEAFRQQLTQEFNDYKKLIDKQIEDYKNYILEKFNEYKTTVDTEINQFETTVNDNFSKLSETMQTQQNEFEAHMVALFTDFTTDENNARIKFEENFQKLFEQWKVDTLNALNQGISGFEQETQTALRNYINAQIEVFRETINVQISEQNRKLQQEKEARENKDQDLQNQINQLTPEGAIKADPADEEGNSQLYTINNDNERENIYPAVKKIGNTTSTVHFLTNMDGVLTNSSYFYIYPQTNTLILKGNNLIVNEDEREKQTIITDFLLIPKSLIKLDNDYTDAFTAFTKLSITLNQIENMLDNPEIYFRIAHMNTMTQDTYKIKYVNYNDVEYLSIPLFIRSATGFNLSLLEIQVSILTT